MHLATVYTRTNCGIYAKLVSVETHISNGLPKFSMVGLAETAVKESKDRVRSALLTSQYEFPARRITVNLAPANLPKSGSGFDLAVAIGILSASNQLHMTKLAEYEFVAELALTGELKSIPGILPMAIANSQSGRTMILAEKNAMDASLVKGANVLFAKSLLEVCAFLTGKKTLTIPQPLKQKAQKRSVDLSDIRGQYLAKRALEIAASGGHSLLMTGPPGCGKTMLATRLPGILPELTNNEALETAAIFSIHHKEQDRLSHFSIPPFRAPHHTASAVALVGGGQPPKPGEISLAHNGVLFLDELPEFEKRVLETLREPLESGKINIARAANQVEFPAEFQLIAAMNPCPCGHWGNNQKNCYCSQEQIMRYRSKLSGPLLERIDVHIDLEAVPYDALLSNNSVGESSKEIKKRVLQTRQRQRERQQKLNSKLNANECLHYCFFKKKEQDFLEEVLCQLQLSARCYHRLLRVARTLADMDRQEKVSSTHLQEALGFREKQHLVI